MSSWGTWRGFGILLCGVWVSANVQAQSTREALQADRSATTTAALADKIDVLRDRLKRYSYRAQYIESWYDRFDDALLEQGPIVLMSPGSVDHGREPDRPESFRSIQRRWIYDPESTWSDFSRVQAEHEGQAWVLEAATGSLTRGESQASVLDEPQNFFLNSLVGSDGLAKFLRKESTQVVAREKQIGIDTVRIEGPGRREGWTSRIWIAPERGYLVLRYDAEFNGKALWSYRVEEVDQTEQGDWIPKLFQTRDEVRVFKILRVRDWEVLATNQSFSYSRFEQEFELPSGVRTTDARTGFTTVDDPWLARTQRFLEQQFDWPSPSLEPLLAVASHELAELEGEQPKPILARTWLNTPKTWEDLRGRVVLLEFWGTWCPPCRAAIPAMEHVYRTWHDSGFEIVSVHTATDEVEEVRSFAEARGMSYPIAIDLDQENEMGQTCGQYGARSFPSVLLLDPQGRFHAVKRGELIDRLRELLVANGARDLPPLARQEGLPEENWQRLAAVWRQWNRDVAGRGKICGVVKDDDGAVLAGVPLRLERVLEVWTGDRSREFREACGEAETDEQGRYVFSALPRGHYQLVMPSQPGSARRRQYLRDDESNAIVNLVCRPRFEVSGRVLDPSGSPLAEAHLFLEAFAAGVDSVGPIGLLPRYLASDERGGFRFPDVPEEAWRLRVLAPGCEPVELGPLRPGSTGLRIALRAAVDD